MERKDAFTQSSDRGPFLIHKTAEEEDVTPFFPNKDFFLTPRYPEVKTSLPLCNEPAYGRPAPAPL